MSGQTAKRGYRERNTTADRTLEILKLFTDERLLLTASEVASELGVARSTAYRYLQSLVSAGFLEDQPGRGFVLGLRVLEIARFARRGTGLPEIALPVMRRLRDELGETVLLTRRIGEQVICVEREEAVATVRISYASGTALPLHAGASALVLIAWMAPDEARAVLAASPLERFTANTLIDIDQLMERLAEIRTRGYAVSHSELDRDVIGVAVPVRDASRKVACAIGIAAFERRLPESSIGRAIDTVRRSAQALEADLALHAV
jgi:DNA-binding IclR family transcriptional regulator